MTGKEHTMDLARSARTPITEAAASLGTLRAAYLKVRDHLGIVDLPADYVETEFIQRIRGYGIADGDVILAYCRVAIAAGNQTYADNVGGRVFDAVIAYCVQAFKAHAAGQLTEAWAYACDARYWSGAYRVATLQAAGKKPPTIQDIARLGASKRHLENWTLKVVALDYYREHEAEFDTLDAAAEAIAGPVVPREWRTVRKWLTEYRKKARPAV